MILSDFIFPQEAIDDKREKKTKQRDKRKGEKRKGHKKCNRTEDKDLIIIDSINKKMKRNSIPKIIRN